MLEFSLASHKDELIEALCTMLSIKSVKSEPQTLMPYGKGVFDALMKMMSFAEHMYFDSVNLYSHMGYVEYGDGDEIFAVLTHLDVVPEGEGWTVPAFAGTVKDGKIYGRGAIDNKGPAVAALFALNAIKENCISLNKRVRLIFGCDEESGWSDIEFYKKNVGEIPVMSISPDAEFPIINAEKGLVHLALTKEAYETGEGGGVTLLSINAGERVNVVPALCECTVRADAEKMAALVELFNADSPVKITVEPEDGCVRLMSHGAPAHGSKPQDGKNAAAYMIAFLNTLPLAKNYLSDAVYEAARYVGIDTDGRQLGIARVDRSGALTLNLGYVKTSESGVEIGLDIRYPVDTAEEFVVSSVKEAMSGFEVKKRFALPAHFVPEDSELVRGLKQAYEEVTGEKASCLTMGGATYARAFPNSVAFGPLFPGQVGTEHQADEYIEIDSLVKLADVIANAIIILCK